MKYKFIIFLFFLGSLSIVIGCGTTVEKKEVSQRSSNLTAQKKKVKKGFYYMVEEGETLTGIAENYDVTVGKISKLNHLPDDNKVKPGQLLYIPKSPGGLKEDQKKAHFIWPVKGEVVKSFNDKKEKGKINLGIDIKFSPSEKIVASEKGKVVFCSTKSDYDFKKELVILKHKGGFNSVYLLRGEKLVGLYELVKREEPILETNSETDSMLHFEIRRNHVPKNPYYFLP